MRSSSVDMLAVVKLEISGEVEVRQSLSKMWLKLFLSGYADRLVLVVDERRETGREVRGSGDGRWGVV